MILNPADSPFVLVHDLLAARPQLKHTLIIVPSLYAYFPHNRIFFLKKNAVQKSLERARSHVTMKKKKNLNWPDAYSTIYDSTDTYWAETLLSWLYYIKINKVQNALSYTSSILLCSLFQNPYRKGQEHEVDQLKQRFCMERGRGSSRIASATPTCNNRSAHSSEMHVLY